MRLLLCLISASYIWGCTAVVTGNSFVDAVIGPQCTSGSGAPGSAQEYSDTVELFESALQVTNSTSPLGLMHPTFNLFNTGTITVTGGSPTITGAGGTTFQTDGCSGGTSPVFQLRLIIQYLGTDGNTRYAAQPVIACNSQTTITLAANWASGPGSFMPACGGGCGGLSYRLDYYQGSAWYENRAPRGYYCTVCAFYKQYYRTGDMQWLTAARTEADLEWKDPQMDMGSCGVNFNSSSGAQCWQTRSANIQGFMLRANDGQASMWVGLRIYRDTAIVPYIPDGGVYIYDQRDASYFILYAALGAIGDPDATERGNWRTKLISLLSGIITPSTGTASTRYDTLFHSLDSWESGWHVQVTNGSTDVILAGTGAAWTTYSAIMAGQMMFFDTPGTRPTANTTEVYHCNQISATHCTLTVPYAGSTNANKGFMLPEGSGQFGLGYGGQPPFIALIGNACELGAYALDGIDNTNRDRFRTCNTNAVTWLMNYGYNSTLNAMYYFSQTANCVQPITDVNCYVNQSTLTVSDNRTMGIETPRTLALNYVRTHNASVLSFGNTLVDGMFKNHTDVNCRVNNAFIYDYNSSAACIANSGAFYVNRSTDVSAYPKWMGQLQYVSTWYAASQSVVTIFGIRVSGPVRSAGPVTRP